MSRYLRAAAVIDSALAEDLPPLYANSSAQMFFNDCRIVAGRVLDRGSELDLRAHLDDWLVDKHLVDVERHRNPRSMFAPSNASSAALALTLAVEALSQPTFREAGSVLAWLATDRCCQQARGGMTGAAWSDRASDSLRSALLSAYADHLRPTDQLRYRAHTAQPGPPKSSSRMVVRAQMIPQQLWHSLAVRLEPENRAMSDRYYRAALSAMILLSGTRDEEGADPEHLLEMPHLIKTMRRLSAIFEAHGLWGSACEAIHMVADFLDATGSPINYERRRRLDYRQLLLPADWQAVLSRFGLTGAERSHRNAAALLFSRVTGSDPSAGAFHLRIATGRQRAEWNEFCSQLHPGVLDELDEIGRTFLRGEGITEPLTWAPEVALFHFGPLTATNAHVDLAELHRAMAEGNSVGQAAARQGVSIEQVRVALLDHPYPRAPEPHTKAHLQWTLERVSRELTPELLRRLLLVEHKSQRQIAAEYGVHRRLVAYLMTEYELRAIA